MKNLILVVLIVLLILAFVPDAWLVKVAGIGGPKVAGAVLKVSGWVKKFKVQLVRLVKRQPKLVDPKTGEPWPPAPIPLVSERDGASVQAVEPSGDGGIPGGEIPSGWKDILKKALPVALPVLLGLIVIGAVGFIRSRRTGGAERWRPEVVAEELSPIQSPSHPDASSGYSGHSGIIPSPYIPSYTPTVPTRRLGSLAREWSRPLVFAWVFAVLCLVTSKLPIVPLSWQELASFLMNFSLLGITPFVILMFVGEALNSILAPWAGGAEKIFGDAGRSAVTLATYTVPLVAVVAILFLLVAKAGGNIVGLAASTDISAVSKLTTGLAAITVGNPFNIALLALSLTGYIIVVMRKIF